MIRTYQYSFKYRHGGGMPEAHQPADNDDHFFKKVLPGWEKETGFKYVPDTVICTASEYRKVPEPQAVAMSPAVAPPAVAPHIPERGDAFGILGSQH